MFTIDGWGNVTIVIHLDTLVGFITCAVKPRPLGRGYKARTA